MNEKLRTGIELPFRINIQRYSRLALSIWESEMSAKDDIESPFDLEEEKNMV